MPDPFYSQAAWQKLRAQTKARWKRDGKACAFCHQPLDWQTKGALIVDHIKNRKQHPRLALDPSNCQVVHHHCNSRKGAWDERGKPRVATGSDGFPENSDWS